MTPSGQFGLLCAIALGLAGATGTAQNFTTLKSFGVLTNVTGRTPHSELVQASDGTLYGTASEGEGNVSGTVFQLQPDGSGFTVLKWFTNSAEGANPRDGLTLSGSTLYGTSYAGGNSGSGTVFKLNTDGTGYTVLKHFTGSDGAKPHASLTLSGSLLYGTTVMGGSSDKGTVFKLNTDGTGYTVLKHFTVSDGANPYAGLTLSGSVLYGTTLGGGSLGYGTVFKVNTDGTSYTVLQHFTVLDGAGPYAGLTLSGSTLYGTTYGGGSSGSGAVFKLNTDGTGHTVLKHFSFATLIPSNGTFTNSDGANPFAGVTLSGSALYGTTSNGGSSGYGTVFKLNVDGTGYTVVKEFTNSDGANPYAGLTLSGGTLYGTTRYGGSSGSPGNGVVFKLNTDGTGYTVLKYFSAATYVPSTGTYTNSDGANPFAGLTLSGSALYGTTVNGGSSGYGTVFKLNIDGTGYTVVKEFINSDGAYPTAGLALSGGMLYGTTLGGGSAGFGTVFQVNTDSSGYTVLKHFTGSDGQTPRAGMTLSGSTLYGTTFYGGSSVVGSGSVFRLDLPIPLTIQSLGDAVVLSWTDPAFALQAAPAVTGTYTNIPGATSSYTNPTASPQRYFRLKMD